jgi:hypothetical protein
VETFSSCPRTSSSPFGSLAHSPTVGAWLIPFFFKYSQFDKKPSPEWTSLGIFHFCIRSSHGPHSDNLEFISVIRVLLCYPRSYWHMPKILPANSHYKCHHTNCLARVTSYHWMPHYGYVTFPTHQGWHKCDSNVVFLSRALLKARSGLQKSDSVVNYLVRQVMQIGFLANLWVIAGLATWFLLPRIPAVFLFDMTLGPMYTHVSGSFFQIQSNIYTNDV